MIDHPSDPENRYLCHSFVESPDMLNVYSGSITTDDTGEGVVRLPAYFGDLNTDLTYQLTVIGRFAQAIIAEELRDNAFTVKTDQPNTKVCWQVTGVRKDPWAEANRIEAEADKPEHERGTYLHPEAHNMPESRGTAYEPDRTFEHEASDEQK
jgi:hypothetical protein